MASKPTMHNAPFQEFRKTEPRNIHVPAASWDTKGRTSQSVVTTLSDADAQSLCLTHPTETARKIASKSLRSLSERAIGMLHVYAMQLIEGKVAPSDVPADAQTPAKRVTMSLPALFKHVSEHGKMTTQYNGINVIFAVAGDKAKDANKGSINVSDDGAWKQNRYFGRIYTDGGFESGKDADSSFLAWLKSLEKDASALTPVERSARAASSSKVSALEAVVASQNEQIAALTKAVTELLAAQKK